MSALQRYTKYHTKLVAWEQDGFPVHDQWWKNYGIEWQRIEKVLDMIETLRLDTFQVYEANEQQQAAIDAHLQRFGEQYEAVPLDSAKARELYPSDTQQRRQALECKEAWLYKQYSTPMGYPFHPKNNRILAMLMKYRRYMRTRQQRQQAWYYRERQHEISMMYPDVFK